MLRTSSLLRNLLDVIEEVQIARGVYPSEILPHHLQTSTTRTDDLHCPLSIEIKAAISNLRAGYSRIIRLCRCVTQVLQSSGR
ncbi:60 kDa chaperonin [Gossypium arboreum]|uniref:60 kDa chaperonin n=1 Tax=Gossypium arboreum TaxID=29729 RepID=A0A0B0MTX3_GOSAR|nr:60 kDa chaperonin [Gossypium arboreum]